jgi:hypothetical protein
MASESQSLERTWTVRALLVLQSPHAVFAALRDDSDEAVSARLEPVMAIVGLAGITGVLWSPVAGSLLDDAAIDNVLVAVWAFIGGVLYGFFGYWLLGGALYAGLRALGGEGSYRRARHLLAFSLAPIALSLFVVWPLRISVFGSDLFRTGGTDHGVGHAVLIAFGIGFALWSLALLVIGVRVVHEWPWWRTLEATALAVALPAVLVFGLSLL